MRGSLAFIGVLAWPCCAFVVHQTRSHSLRLTALEEEDTATGADVPANQSAFEDDVPDRFKYKVHALMGTFSPPAEVDNENENGNILNAMLTFPVWYSFHVVGKTFPDRESEFVEQVKAVVGDVAGKDDLRLSVTPRGSKFTKVTIEAEVHSAQMITAIYSGLEGLEMSVMQF